MSGQSNPEFKRIERTIVQWVRERDARRKSAYGHLSLPRKQAVDSLVDEAEKDLQETLDAAIEQLGKKYAVEINNLAVTLGDEGQAAIEYAFLQRYSSGGIFVSTKLWDALELEVEYL